MLACVAVLMTQAACTPPGAQVSEEGRLYCRQIFPVVHFSNREEQARSDHQKCLETIDGELAKNREKLASQSLEHERMRQQQISQREKEMIMPEARYAYCRMHMQDVVHAEAVRARLLPARTSAYKDPNLSDTERAAIVQAYAAAEAQLASLIPKPYRGSMELIPTAVSAFSTCDSKIFFAQH